jgi:WD40 repeat protein
VNRLRIACGFAILLTTLAGCGRIAQPDLSPTPATPASPLPTASSPPLPGPVSTTPTAPLSALATPPPARDEEGVLRALYGERLQGNAQDGWLVGLGTIPWAGPSIAGSFTAPGSAEMVALVGGLSTRPTDAAGDEEYLDVRWVVLRDDSTAAQGERWRAVGRSPGLGSNLDRSAIPWRVLSLTDFDQDGRQELYAVSGSTSPDFQSEVARLFRWDGESLAQVWTAPTFEDSTGATSAPAYYTYRAEVIFGESGGAPELALQGTTRYFGTDEQGQANTDVILGSEAVDRRFRWDGVRFNEFSAAGPATPFAFTDAGGLWLWESGQTRPLDERQVDDLAWSPDGLRLAYEVWWPADEQGVWLYDMQTNAATQMAATGAAVYTLQWSPDGSILAYPLAHPGEIRLHDLDSGADTNLPANAESLSWAPSGQWLVYAQRGSLVRYDPATQRAEPLVSASAGAGTTAPGAYRAAWSPRGDLIACVVADGDAESLALVSPDLTGPVEATALSALTTGVTASRIESRWSPQGDRIAVLATDPRLATQPGVLYVVEVPTGWAGETPLEPRELARLDDPAQPISPPAWSADGRRLAAVVGAEVWVWDAETATGQRWHAFPATFEEVSVHWAPGGSGFLVHHGEQLHWFTADAPGDPVPLLQRNGLDRIEFAGP